MKYLVANGGNPKIMGIFLCFSQNLQQFYKYNVTVKKTTTPKLKFKQKCRTVSFKSMLHLI